MKFSALHQELIGIMFSEDEFNDLLTGNKILSEQVAMLEFKLAKARGALEFYANPDNWKKSNVDNASKIHGDDVEHIVGMLLHRGGRRAREALKGE